MIKINLLPQKRGKTRAIRAQRVARVGDTGGRDLVIGIMALFAVGALVFLAVDLRKRGGLEDAKAERAKLQQEINQKKNDKKISVGDYDLLVTQKADAIKQIQSTRRLMDTRIVPGNVLHELGQILTSRGPTMSTRMNKLMDVRRDIQYDWDATHVWLTAFKDAAGVFTLEGGAQSKEDVTQLQKRLAASIYFMDVTPAGGQQAIDDSGINYYKFSITGKVVY